MDRSMVGQEGKEKPFVPVPKEDQKWAMTLLTKYAFAPNAFQIPSDIYSYLQRERRGWSGTKDPNVLNMFLNMQIICDCEYSNNLIICKLFAYLNWYDICSTVVPRACSSSG